jgi:hypothetical protein
MTAAAWVGHFRACNKFPRTCCRCSKARCISALYVAPASCQPADIAEHYIILLIDNNVIGFHVTREPQEMRPLEWNLPVEVIWWIPINLGTRVDHSSAPTALRSIVRRGGFDLSALAADEFHPRGQSSATEIGIRIGDCPRCLPGQCEIVSGSRDVARGKRIRRSQVILE